MINPNRIKNKCSIRLAFCLTGLLFLMATPASGQSGISGRVYVDVNRNNVLDDGEPLVSGIAVSSGNQRSITGNDGAYALALPDGVYMLFCERASDDGTVAAGWTCGRVSAPTVKDIPLAGWRAYFPIFMNN